MIIDYLTSLAINVYMLSLIYLGILTYWYPMLSIIVMLMLGITLRHDSSEAHFTSFGKAINKYMDEKFIGWKAYHTSQIKEGEKERKNGGIIYACHPHGILPCSMFHFANRGIPVVADYGMLKGIISPFPLKWHGFVDNRRETLVKTIQEYGNLLLYPGGADELCLVTGNRKKFNVFMRTGFIRLAIEKGYTIVPVLAPAEEEAYTPFMIGWSKFKHYIWKKLKITLGMHHGRYWLMTVPRRITDPCIYYGNPIVCKSTDTVEDVNVKYMEEIARLAELAKVDIKILC